MGEPGVIEGGQTSNSPVRWFADKTCISLLARLRAAGAVVALYRPFIRREDDYYRSINLSGNNDLIALRKWMKMHGYHGDDLKPVLFKDTGRGLMTRKPLQVDDIIISIPKNLLITTQTVLESEIGVYIKSYSPLLTPLQALGTFLMFEKSKGIKSKWYPYIKVLPEMFTTPSYYSPEELACLPDFLQLQAKKQIAAVRDAYEHIKTLLVTMETKLTFCHGMLSYKEFCWAWFVINTRSVYMKQESCEFLKPEEDAYALAPFLDLLNHSPTVEVRAAYNSTTQCYEIRTSTPYKKYDQVFICYGPHDNVKLLLEYGFLVPHNPHNVVSFDIDDLIKCFKNRHWTQQSSGDALLEKKLQILSSNHLTSDLSCGMDGFSWRLQTVLRILCMDFNELNSWKRILTGEECSQQTEAESKQLSVEIIQKELEENLVTLQKSGDLPKTLHLHFISMLHRERQLILTTLLQSIQSS